MTTLEPYRGGGGRDDRRRARPDGARRAAGYDRPHQRSGREGREAGVRANDVMVAALDATGSACTLVSEEMEEIRHRLERGAGSRFVVCFDPVDGSSDLDVNRIVGTIFSVSRKRGDGADHAGGRLHHVRAVHSARPDDGRRRAWLHAGPGDRDVRPHACGPADSRPGTCVQHQRREFVPVARGRATIRGARPRGRRGQRAALHGAACGLPGHRRVPNAAGGGIYLYPKDAAGTGKQSSGKRRRLYECAWSRPRRTSGSRC